MYFVIHTNVYGSHKPVAFTNLVEATFYKRCMSVIEASRSGHLDNFSEKHGDIAGDRMISLSVSLLKTIESGTYSYCFSKEESEVFDQFVTFLEGAGNNLSAKADYINFSDETFVGYEVHEMPEVIPASYETNAGKATIRYYDDGCADGVQILLDDTIVCALDVYAPAEGEKEGEARVLVYKKEYAEDEEEAPIECIAINR